MRGYDEGGGVVVMMWFVRHASHSSIHDSRKKTALLLVTDTYTTHSSLAQAEIADRR